MTAEAILNEVQRRGAILTADGTKLKLRGPREVLTGELVGLARRHKAALLKALQRGRPRKVSAPKPPLDSADVLEEIGKALVGLRDDPDGSAAWQLICADPDLHDRFAAGERCIETAQRDGDANALRWGVLAYRDTITEALARVKARAEVAAEGRDGDGG